MAKKLTRHEEQQHSNEHERRRLNDERSRLSKQLNKNLSVRAKLLRRSMDTSFIDGKIAELEAQIAEVDQQLENL